MGFGVVRHAITQRRDANEMHAMHEINIKMQLNQTYNNERL